MTTPNIEELIARLRTSMGDLDCPNTYEFAMHQAADALQSQQELLSSQAERIKTLEEQDVQNDYNLEIASRKIEALRAELNTTEVLLEECKMDWSGDVTQIKAEHKHELDQLRAQLAAIAATEPVAEYVVRTDAKGKTNGICYMKGKAYSLIDGSYELFTRPMPAQDVNAELVEALEKLARLGNGEHYGNSDGNMIARTALSKYKGGK